MLQPHCCGGHQAAAGKWGRQGSCSPLEHAAASSLQDSCTAAPVRSNWHLQDKLHCGVGVEQHASSRDSLQLRKLHSSSSTHSMYFAGQLHSIFSMQHCCSGRSHFAGQAAQHCRRARGATLQDRSYTAASTLLGQHASKLYGHTLCTHNEWQQLAQQGC